MGILIEYFVWHNNSICIASKSFFVAKIIALGISDQSVVEMLFCTYRNHHPTDKPWEPCQKYENARLKLVHNS